MLPTAEQFLSNLPFTLLIWTAVTLCWGIYTHIINNRMMLYADKNKNGRRESDQYVTYCLMLGNGFLLMFILLQHTFIDYVDMIIVINVFYNIFLLFRTRDMCRWWKTTLDTNDKIPR